MGQPARYANYAERIPNKLFVGVHVVTDEHGQAALDDQGDLIANVSFYGDLRGQWINLHIPPHYADEIGKALQTAARICRSRKR